MSTLSQEMLQKRHLKLDIVKNSSFNWTRKPDIKFYIDECLDQLKKESIAEQDEIMQYLTPVFRGEQKEQTLVGESMGEQSITDIDVSAKNRIKAAELLGKRYAMWTDKTRSIRRCPVTFVDDIGSDPNDN